MIYIATTTINPPTKALKKFASNKNCKLIVALDKKSKKFKLKNSIVLSTLISIKNGINYQYDWMELYSTKKFAILEAYERGAEVIALIDDDNIPYNNWFKNIYVNKKIYCSK